MSIVQEWVGLADSQLYPIFLLIAIAMTLLMTWLFQAVSKSDGGKDQFALSFAFVSFGLALVMMVRLSKDIMLNPTLTESVSHFPMESWAALAVFIALTWVWTYLKKAIE